MKIPRLFRQISLAGALLLTGACEGFLDVNQDPTSPPAVPEHLLLSGLLSSFSYEVIGNEPARTTSLWTQQTAWMGDDTSPDNYNFNESDSNNFWNNTYTTVLNNARRLNELAEENETHAYAGMAKVIQVWSFSILTDLWDEVPYSQAFDAGNHTPAYDSQEFIYSRIFILLDEAIADFDQVDTSNPAYSALSSHDLLYGGNIGKWERMAHTLAARLHLRLSDAPGPGRSATDQANLALGAVSDGFFSNEDDADFRYFNSNGAENPWYQYTIDGKWTTYQAVSATYIELLESLNDPRLPLQARPVGAVNHNGPVPGFSTTTPEYNGHVNGESNANTVLHSAIGAFYSSPGSSLSWISYAEARFIEAEATLITSGPADAQGIYEDAVRASMDKLGVDSADADSYINGLSPLAAGDALEKIITQKYIANFLNQEVFNDWRRTGYPILEPVENNPRTPSGEIPVRYPYPSSEYAYNEAVINATGIPVGYEGLERRVWWNSVE